MGILVTIILLAAAQLSRPAPTEVPADIDYFEKNAADDPELMLLIVGMSRVETLSEKTSSGLTPE